MEFDAPIAGSSLTTEPGNSPWENPPLFDTPEEALGYYFQMFDDDDKLEDMMFALEQGLPISVIVSGLTSMGVMEGYHTFDVKVLISPFLHEQIVTLAEVAGIKFTETTGPSKDERDAAKKKKRAAMLIDKMLDGPPAEQPSAENITEATEAMGEETVPTHTSEPMPSKGLIPRRA